MLKYFIVDRSYSFCIFFSEVQCPAAEKKEKKEGHWAFVIMTRVIFMAICHTHFIICFIKSSWFSPLLLSPWNSWEKVIALVYCSSYSNHNVHVHTCGVKLSKCSFLPALLQFWVLWPLRRINNEPPSLSKRIYIKKLFELVAKMYIWSVNCQLWGV